MRNLKLFAKIIVATGGAVASAKTHADTLFKRFRWLHPVSRSPTLRNPLVGGGNWLLRDPAELMRKAAPLAALAAQSEERALGSIQSVEGAEIRGTWTKTVFDAEGAPIFKTGEVFEGKIPESVRARIRELTQSRAETLERLRAKLATTGRTSTELPARLELVPAENGTYDLQWVVGHLNPAETEAFETRFSESGVPLETRAVGHHHAEDGFATVFPKGPRESRLEDVPLPGLDSSGYLSSQKLVARSAKGEAAHSPERHFHFAPTDGKFDQVQAYFYADTILKWFKDRFGAEITSRLELKLHVGSQSNAAFYYANLIRLGEGDGVKYRDLPRDPSIVMHEVVHAVIDACSRLPSDGEGGGLNEGFADFFAAAYLKNPNLGEVASVSAPYARTLKNSMVSSVGLTKGLYTAAQFIGGTLWDIREFLGEERGETLAFRTLLRLGPGSKYQDFVPSLLAAADGLVSEVELNRMKEILRAREWPSHPEGARS